MSIPPHWLRGPDLDRFGVPPVLQPWMHERGSLTVRLRQEWPDLRLQVLREETGVLLGDEISRLGLNADEVGTVWVREVQMWGGGRPRLLARTAIPHWGPENPWAAVATLGARPLGELLFTWPGVQRSEFEWSTTLSWAPTRWARRCQFDHQGAPLLLTEVFTGITAHTF